ncbi:hypothetical protein [Nocardia sp. SSK8]|uniref:hypothetical protein n=1 Tax=Nocardia sp. SSK8 TaxID=3120154 RepID=UPI00300A561F
MAAVCAGLAVSVGVVASTGPASAGELLRKSPHTVTKTYTTTTTLKSTRTTVTQSRTTVLVPLLRPSGSGAPPTTLVVVTKTETSRNQPATVYKTVVNEPVYIAETVAPRVTETVTVAKPPPRHPR